MIVDSSALVALATDEPSRPAVFDALVSASRVAVPATTWVETSLVLGARAHGALDDFLDEFTERFDADVVSFTADHAREAQAAWRAFGRGNHPASLNYGDCMVYAVAKATGEPLLYVGEDFRRTGIESVLGAP